MKREPVEVTIDPEIAMIDAHPDVFWGLVASMWIGNVFLIVLNVPMVRYWLTLFKNPYAVLFPSILFFCGIGTYSLNNSFDDVLVTAGAALIGYVFLRLHFEAAPLILGLFSCRCSRRTCGGRYW